jgi:hypothetical protein
MCISQRLAYAVPPIFRIILHWNQVLFQGHLVLDNSSDLTERGRRYAGCWPGIIHRIQGVEQPRPEHRPDSLANLSALFDQRVHIPRCQVAHIRRYRQTLQNAKRRVAWRWRAPHRLTARLESCEGVSQRRKSAWGPIGIRGSSRVARNGTPRIDCLRQHRAREIGSIVESPRG